MFVLPPKSSKPQLFKLLIALLNSCSSSIQVEDLDFSMRRTCHKKDVDWFLNWCISVSVEGIQSTEEIWRGWLESCRHFVKQLDGCISHYKRSQIFFVDLPKNSLLLQGRQHQHPTVSWMWTLFLARVWRFLTSLQQQSFHPRSQHHTSLVSILKHGSGTDLSPHLFHILRGYRVQ